MRQNDYRGNYHDYVSPTGEYVVFMSQGYSDGFFYLLNVQTREVIPLNDKTARCQGVSWKPDGSSVFLLSGKEALLHYPKEGRTKDISDDYDNSFRRYLKYGPSIDALWTPDEEYIVINSSKTGGCLVHPDPWQVVAIGKRLVNHLEGLEHRRVYRDAPDSYPYLLVQPYPGWVSLCIRFVTGKKPNLQGRGRLMEARNYLVDYKGKRFLPMDSLDSPDDIWTFTITPDGQKRVYFKHSIFLDEASFHLPVKTINYVPLKSSSNRKGKVK